MHTSSVEPWRHGHIFLGKQHQRHERRTWLVVWLTAMMMIAEIVGGAIYGSMALTADGWHMATHAGALMIAALAYRFADRHTNDPRFSFGTGKFGELAAFTSAIILAFVAVLIGYESTIRVFAPVAIRFDEAIALAVVGLFVNLASAWMLRDREHGHGNIHDRKHDHDHNVAGYCHDASDHNIRAAYAHVLADALTSVFAIVALLAGRFQGWTWLDPVMGLVGALVIAIWAANLVRSSGAVLLDTVPGHGLSHAIRERLEVGGDRVADLHLWRLGPGHAGMIASVISDRPQSPAAYKERLADIEGLSHLTIEVHRCNTASPLAA